MMELEKGFDLPKGNYVLPTCHFTVGEFSSHVSRPYPSASEFAARIVVDWK